MLWGRAYMNKKNDKIYYVLGEATDATNGREHQRMILYRDNEGHWYVREATEFFNKFDDIEP